MLILGIDPGIARLGWGLVDEQKGKLLMVDYGCLETSPKKSEPERLEEIYNFLLKLIKTHNPEAVAIEELFFAANAKTALTVGQARGVAVLTIKLSGKDIFSYTPLQVKQAITGYGRADKKQMQLMVKTLLKLNKIPEPDDAADALAIAITHAFSYKMQR